MKVHLKLNPAQRPDSRSTYQDAAWMRLRWHALNQQTLTQRTMLKGATVRLRLHPRPRHSLHPRLQLDSLHPHLLLNSRVLAKAGEGAFLTLPTSTGQNLPKAVKSNKSQATRTQTVQIRMMATRQRTQTSHLASVTAQTTRKLPATKNLCHRLQLLSLFL